MMMPKQKPREPGAGDLPELRAGETELGAPVGENAAADAEAHAGGENGRETGPEQTTSVGGDAVLSNIHGCLARSNDFRTLPGLRLRAHVKAVERQILS